VKPVSTAPAAAPVRRRDVLARLGGLGFGLGVAVCAPGSVTRASRVLSPAAAFAQQCTLTPEQTEGPYYIEDALQRRNVTEGKAGVRLVLLLEVQDAASCAPIPGAVGEIWHADALGDYSGFNGEENDTFLRGRQICNAAGRVRFRTLYPGWYRGRTTHIHVKVDVGGDEVHTGQLYFDDAVTDAVYARQPYASRGTRDTTNAEDGIFANGGSQSTLALRVRGAGYRGKLTLGVVA